jgi:beta-glucanase (GH16 family)
MAIIGKALSESFDDGFGTLGNVWNVDHSVMGEIKLAGHSGIMEWATGKDAGHGYGTYTVTAKVDGNQPGPGIVFWPGNDQWPGQEIDLVEVTPDGSGRQYGTVHWNDGGSDAYEPKIFEGVEGGVFHDYQMIWEPGRITFKVDGAEKGVITDHVPLDFASGGMNNTIGFMNNNPDTSLTVRHVEFTPLGETAPDSAPAFNPEFEPTILPASEEPVITPDVISHDGPVDWNAIAAQVMANYAATGSWHL